MSSPPAVTVSVTTGSGSGWDVTASGVSDVDVVVCSWGGCWVDSGDDSVEEEGEGSTTGSGDELGSEDGEDSAVGAEESEVG